MKLIDLLLVAALTTLALAVATVVPVAGLVVFSAGCVGLWFLLGDEVEG